MRHEKHLELKLDGDSATLCVHGALDRTSDSFMLDCFAALPLHIRTLRVDLRALGAMSGEATSAVRSLLAHWRTTRGGEFTKAYAPILVLGALGGGVIGWVVGRFGC